MNKNRARVKASEGLGSLRAAAAAVRAAGTHGDTILAHISPREARMLDYLSDRKIDFPVNRKTGLPTFDEGDSDDDSHGDMGPGGSSGPGGMGVSPGGMAGDPSVNDMGADTRNEGGTSFGLNEKSYYNGPLTTESILSTPSGFRAEGYGGIGIDRYDPKDTWGRVWQEIWNPSVAVPGRFEAPNALGPGIAKTLAGAVVGGPMSGLMSLGAAMARASSSKTQAASAAEMAERGAMNSTGNDPRIVQAADAGGSAGASAGAATGAGAGTRYVMKPPTDGWDENGFLARNPEVARAVENGTWASGRSFADAYRAQAGASYDAAKAIGLVDPFTDDMLTAQPGQAVFAGR